MNFIPLLIKPLMGVLGKMAASMISEMVIKHFVLSIVEYYVSWYEKKTLKTEDKMDDLRAKKLRDLFNVIQKNWEE